MNYSRRYLLAGLSALSLAACQSGGAGAVAAPTRAAGSSMRAVPNAGFDAWVEGAKARARAQGISASIVTRAFRGVGFLPGVVERDRNQAEFVRSFEDYLAIAASDARIDKGRAMLRKHASLLKQLEAKYGVEKEVIVAVWGLESRYGERRGDVPVISALSTLAYDGRRGRFFEGQLMAALKILERGDVSADRMTGSWAGAMGHTQFIPTSYLAYAVDFRGDGKRDIWSDDPTDALASTAAYLSRSGWKRGQRWGDEITGRAPSGRGRVVKPAGDSGPVFEVYHNYSVIGRYNNAQKYIIGVGHLSDRLAGRPALRATFGPDEHGLTLADRKALQRGLTRAGFDAGEADGVLGKKTFAAIEAFQRARGLAVTGTPSKALLAMLR
ncbi:lytic murein transglycosylase [Aliiroseovarius halocynthiae]|uniref:Lytic murein transglycosylase n=1 Tax=Aliiroseovarius halocynthiae TaxID=985055 RepID=A0A545SSF2_9RHOB|nr:lytic murein transglycosylase [Aliiroseovarius halocynthiae]TQV67910.1 lytic murein transglycosylase [Aliiroseovarius halocynthiae]SMR73010.1 lytic murein transglycosylase [Aliiroseovarius halocynthiae]